MKLIMSLFKTILKLTGELAFIVVFLGFHIAQASISSSDLNNNGIPDNTETEVVVNSNMSLPAGEYNFQNLIVTNNAILTMDGDPLSTDTFKGVKINLANLTIDSGASISADGKGYGPDTGPGIADTNGAGASYGGIGFANTATSIYGSAMTPVELGSGGASRSSGGGAVRLVVSNILKNDGSISANGEPAGSGGSIYVMTKKLEGAGIFRGNGGGLFAGGFYRGPGGGGRVAIYYEMSSFSGKSEAKGGCGSYDGYSLTCAGAGTAGWFDTVNNNFLADSAWQFQKSSSPFNFNHMLLSGAKVTSEDDVNINASDLIVDKNSSLVLGENQILNIPNISVDGVSTLTLSGSEKITANTFSVLGGSTVAVLPKKVLSLAIPNINISSDGSISTNVKGYCAGMGPGAPGITYDPNNQSLYYAGASYGGVGFNNTPLSVYGSDTVPTEFGSAGNASLNDACGGGAIRIITDTLVNNGTISSNGGSGSSGGSVYLTTKSLDGSGAITAKGGSYYCPGVVCYNPGAGGRIAVYYGNSTFSGNVNVDPGYFCSSGCNLRGEVGTIVLGPPKLSHTPVLIIPGVLGTDILKGSDKLWLDLARNFTDIGDQFMDPLQFKNDLNSLDINLTLGDLVKNPLPTQHFYDLIIQELKTQGYIEGKNSSDNLFLFPYDWRYGVNTNTINQLQQKIQDIRTQTGSNEVDVVAHSTGGLLLKKYVMDNLSNNHIGKAVLVGVPNTGAPKAIKVLLQGDNFGIPWLADSEMKKLAQNLPVVYDLAPSQQYYNQKGSYVKIINQGFLSSSSKDLDFNQATNFLSTDHALNAQGIIDANNLHTANFDNFDLRTAGVDLYSIVGCKSGTLGKIVERRTQSIFGGVNISYDQPEETPGDGTVTLESATNLPINSSNKYYALKADHGKMPSQEGIRQEIVNIITGSNLNIDSNKITQDITKCKLNGKALSVFSPLDIDATDQEGNHSGLADDGSIENNIPNADFQIMGEHKFVYLPTDEGQTYRVSLKGTGSGTFTLKSTDVVDNQIAQTETYSDIPVTTNLKGTLDIVNFTNLSLDNNGDGKTDIDLLGIPNGIVTLPKPLTVTADNKNITLGGPIPSFTSTLSGFVNGDTATNSITGAPICTTTATSTSLVGTYPITCIVGTLSSSKYSFLTFVAGSLKINYRFDGFLQPINDTAHQVGQNLSVFTAGSTVPVKFQLKKSDGTIVQAGIAPIWLAPQKGSAMSSPIDESVYGDVGTIGTSFKSDGSQYSYNWSTQGLTAGYWHKISVKLDDGNVYSVTVGLK